MYLIKNKVRKSMRLRSGCQRGSTLIEVLVAMLVLSIGLVGLAALQLNGLRFNQSAYLRTQSTILAYDMIDRMRANRGEARNGSYDLTLAATTSAVNCSSSCTAANMVNFDKYQWKDMVGDSLPSGNGSVATVATGATRVVRVTVQWDETRGEISGTQSLSVDAEI